MSQVANPCRLANEVANPRPVEMEMGTARQRPFSVSQGKHPFSDRRFERDGVAMHYVDEGTRLRRRAYASRPTAPMVNRMRVEGSGTTDSTLFGLASNQSRLVCMAA